MNGKWPIISMVVVALGLAIVARWYHFEQHNQIRAHWGEDETHLVGAAPLVEVLVLSTAETDGSSPVEVLQLPGPVKAQVSRTLDVTRAPGLIHARDSLLRDYNYEWSTDAKQPPQPAEWKFAMRFTESGKSAVLAFDVANERVTMAADSAVPLKMTGIVEKIDGYLKPLLAESEDEKSTGEKTDSPDDNKTTS